MDKIKEILSKYCVEYIEYVDKSYDELVKELTTLITEEKKKAVEEYQRKLQL